VPSLVVRDSYEGGYYHGGLVRAEVREGFGTHQIAMLDYPVPAGSFSNLAPELTPMGFQWGLSPTAIRTFYGYVNHHELVDSDVDGEMYLRFFCVGTSQSLDDPEPSSWKNVTASYIARLVAERHGLRAIVHNSKTLLPYWTPGQQSDFLMLNRLAEETGYRFWVDGATLYFLDPLVLLTSPDRALAASYTFDRTSDDTLFGVRSIHGSLAPVDSAPSVSQVFGINDDAGTLIKASSRRDSADRGLSAPLSTRVYPKSVGSLAEAHRVTENASASGTWSSLQALTVGDGRARVGSLVSLDGDALNSKYAGTWMASDITHVLSPAPGTGTLTYTAQVELTRNQLDQPFFSSFSSLKDALSEVPAVLRNGRWEASILESVYV
jgi:hypothetical protein